MGSSIEFNDTLKLDVYEGFPWERLDIKKHSKKPIKLEDIIEIAGGFEFRKKGKRVYHSPPTRVFLVQVIDGKWLYWGHAIILNQTIHGITSDGEPQTSGNFRITKLYDPEYQRLVTINESPKGKSYF